jgi:hypothetical protein
VDLSDIIFFAETLFHQHLCAQDPHEPHIYPIYTYIYIYVYIYMYMYTNSAMKSASLKFQVSRKFACATRGFLRSPSFGL